MKQSAIRIALLLCCLILFSANAQLRKASDYFPLQIGNVWEYKPDPDFYPDRHIEIVSDTMIADTVRIYRALIRYVDNPSAGFGYNYYHYNEDSTIVFRDIEFPIAPYTGLPMIDTRDRVGTIWAYPLGDYLAAFAITDTGSAFYFDRMRSWARVQTGVFISYPDSVRFDETFWIFVEGIGPVSEGIDTLRYARINGIEYGTPLTSVYSCDNPGVPTESALQIYPNPIHEKTTIIVNVTSLQPVEITVVSLLGRTIRTIFDSTLPIGAQRVSWDSKDNQGKRVSHGVYFVVMRTNQHVITHKIVYLTDW